MTPAERRRKAYPLTARDAWLQFLIGGVAPRPINPAVMRRIAQLEKQPRR